MSRIGVVALPGSVDHRDVGRAVRLAGAEPVPVWHDAEDLVGVDAIILPGRDARGLPPGHELGAGSTPILAAVARAAGEGRPVLGIGDGFQALCDAHLLPGALAPNAGGLFVCRDETLRVETRDTVWTCALEEGRSLTLVLRTAAGRYTADEATLQRLEDGHQVVLRHEGGDPTGSANGIAGLTNERGNVVGLVPHPQYSIETLTGPSEDGRMFLRSLLVFLAAARPR